MPPPILFAASAPGLGGIGVLLLVGDGAADLVARVLGAPLRNDAFARGRIRDAAGPVEEVVCRRIPAPASPFGAEVVEIDTHGSPVSLARCREAITAAGASAGDPADLPALLSSSRGWDPIRREAVRLLLAARTRLAAAMLLDQAAGALSRSFASLCADPPRERAVPVLRNLLAGAGTGIALVAPRRVALIGPPNAGKSTLFNRLVGRERALVHPTPGTTRDPVEEEIALEGVPLHLSDTAGVRETGHPIERLGIEETLRAAREADLLLAVGDATDPGGGAEVFDAARRRRPECPMIPVWNKSDLAAGTAPPESVSCSALTGAGLDTLAWAILVALAIDPALVRPGAPLVFLAGQREAIEQALELAGSGAAEWDRPLRARLQ